MSRAEQATDDDEVCATCGKAAVDNVKLKMCTACKLVKYCSVDCQKNHRPNHKKACRKRAAEIRDDKLFQQPDESYLGECPICCLPLPIDPNKKWMINSCCYKIICKGCEHANDRRELEAGLEHKCPYCREPVPETKEEANQNEMKRVKANDPDALCQVGTKRYNEGDYETALKYLTKAAELGDAAAHNNLAGLYHKGEGVEKNEKKEVHHLEEAAICGHPSARFNLANHEGRKGNTQKAVKHFIIAAKLGYDVALEALMKCFQRGVVSKEDYEAALRGHQAAVDAMKSEQRKEAEEFYKLLNQD